MKNENNWIFKSIIFIAGQTISLFGSSVVAYAIVWYITLETSSAKMMTISILCSFLPQILISLFAGVWADRYNRKLIIIFSDLFIAVATLILAIVFLMGEKSLTLIFIASIIRSIGSGIQAPAVNAVLPQIVPSEKLTKVNSINITMANSLNLVSPAFGGFVLATLGFEFTLFVDVITALIAVVIMSFLKLPKSKEVLESKSAILDLKEGLVYIKHHAFIGKLLIFYIVFYFLITPVAFLSPIMVERSFGSDIWRLTANEMAWALGNVLGGGIMVFWGGYKNHFHTMAFSCVGFGITIAILGLSTNFNMYLLILLISGLFMPLFGTAETVLIQENAQENMLGRVFSVVQIISSAALPLGMLFFGPLGDVVKIEYIMLTTGILVVVLATYIKNLSKSIST